MKLRWSPVHRPNRRKGSSPRFKQVRDRSIYILSFFRILCNFFFFSEFFERPISGFVLPSSRRFNVSITELYSFACCATMFRAFMSSDGLVISCQLPVFSPIDTGVWCRVTRASHHHDSMEFFAGRVRHDLRCRSLFIHSMLEPFPSSVELLMLGKNKGV
jgi:hypothetical protein